MKGLLELTIIKEKRLRLKEKRKIKEKRNSASLEMRSTLWHNYCDPSNLNDLVSAKPHLHGGSYFDFETYFNFKT